MAPKETYLFPNGERLLIEDREDEGVGQGLGRGGGAGADAGAPGGSGGVAGGAGMHDALAAELAELEAKRAFFAGLDGVIIVCVYEVVTR